MDIKDKTDIQEKTLERMLSWIKNVDSKSQLIIAIDLALIGAVVREVPSKLNLGVLAAFAVAIAGAVYGLYMCVAAAAPHLDGPPSLIFFGKIKFCTRQEYQELVNARTDEEYLSDLDNQIYQNAIIADRKYRNLRRATVWTVRGVIPWSVVMYCFVQGLIK